MNRPCLAVLAAILGALIPVPGFSQEPEIESGYILMDDMVLPAEALSGGDSVFTFMAPSWPYGVVPYSFHANVNATNQNRAIRAMNELSAVAGLIFVPRTNHANWIAFEDSTQNSSYVGMKGGSQKIRIADWSVKYIIVHEIKHALGFMHEHQRGDRQTYITVNPENIMTGKSHNFGYWPLATTLTPYDFLSLMHYPRGGFSKNGQDTITCNPPYAQYQDQIGNMTFMTHLDAQGLQAKYGPSSASPALTSLGSNQVYSGINTLLTVSIYGSGFFEGSPNSSGVQGTRAQWNGVDVETEFVTPTYLQARVPAMMVANPGTYQVTVYNPWPGSNFSSLPLPVTVLCPTTPISLQQGVPATTTNGCANFTITPAYNSFNVVAVSSPADWDITMGTASAAAGGSACDFVAGSGFMGAGTVTPASGSLTLYGGASAATLHHATSTPLNLNQPTIAEMAPGSVVRAFHFQPAVSSGLAFHVAGPTNLGWRILYGGNPANGFSWRSSTADIVASGQVGDAPIQGISVVSAPYVLVVYSSGGPISSSASLTLTMSLDFTPVTLVSGTGYHTMSPGPYQCTPFTLGPPLGNAWAVAGVSSTSDWDIQIGPAASQFGGSSPDYVLANGNLGAISPLTGISAPFTSVPATAYLQFGPTTWLNGMPASNSQTLNLFGAFEFYVQNPGNYQVSVNCPGFQWDHHGPGTSSAWRSRSSRTAGPFNADGATVTLTNLATGWHCAVAYKIGAPPGSVFASATVAPALPPPGIASLIPDVAPAGSPSTLLRVLGSNFAVASQIVWNESVLVTTFINSSEVRATLTPALLATPGIANVRVQTPASGTSATLPFTIGNPVPILSSLSTTYAMAGTTPLTLLVSGSNFLPNSVVLWNGSPLITANVSGITLGAYLSSYQLALPGFYPVVVYNPGPGGGASAGITYQILAPVLTSVTPGSSPLLPAGGLPIPLAIGGFFFHPWSRVYANQTELPTTFIDSDQLTATLDPAIFDQSAYPGALAISVVNTSEAVSNLMPFVFDAGSNAGMIRAQPVAPFAGSDFAIRVEAGLPLAPVTLVADAGGPVPVRNLPPPAHNLVLGVTEAAGSNGPWIAVVDGAGLFGPPAGVFLDASGVLLIPGLLMPSPPANIQVSLQAAYLDPAAPLGFRLTWPLHTFGL
jgi:hypothetical protein